MIARFCKRLFILEPECSHWQQIYFQLVIKTYKKPNLLNYISNSGIPIISFHLIHTHIQIWFAQVRHRSHMVVLQKLPSAPPSPPHNNNALKMNQIETARPCASALANFAISAAPHTQTHTTHTFTPHRTTASSPQLQRQGVSILKMMKLIYSRANTQRKKTYQTKSECGRWERPAAGCWGSRTEWVCVC